MPHLTRRSAALGALLLGAASPLLANAKPPRDDEAITFEPAVFKLRDGTELPGNPSEAVMGSIDAAAEDRHGPTAAEPQRSNKVATGGPRIEINETNLPENILWQETSSLEDGYEKVTF